MKNDKTVSKEPKTETDSKSSQNYPADFKCADLDLSVVEMLKSGVHFGHKSSRWNPRMQPYLWGTKNGIHIIDLEKTFSSFQKALDYIKMVVSNGGKILFIGTKPQARNAIEWAARETDMFFVSNRWLGGTFTNFREIKKRIRYLNDQEEKMARGELEKYTKYEQGKMRKEMEKMNEKMGGIKKMESLPQLVFAVDVKEDNLAIKEARFLKIPVVAICDSNIDPDIINFPIPGNDDALSSIKYILGIVVKKIKEAKSKTKTAPEEKENKRKNNSTK